jgi:dUTP pyrophosphatase
MVLKVKKLSPEANIPPKPYAGDAGIDLCAAEEVVIPARDRARVPTGLAVELPEGCVGLIWDKSGMALKQGIKVMGGVIDQGFRGEIVMCLANLSNEPQTIQKGQKAAQLLVQKVENVSIEEVAELAPSERGASGWGSSGIH